MDNLFAYGTLMCEDIFQAVTGCQCPGFAGELEQYRRLRIRGEEYPGLIAAEGFTVTGIVYPDLSRAAWENLDSFEGGMYERRPVEVVLRSGEIWPASTYVIRNAFEDRLEPAPWSREDFLRTGKKRFQATYPGFGVRD